MKKILFTLAAMLMTVLPSEAMSYEQARQQALFLADKMAYELNLTEEQYEAVYEINLDYLMSVNSYDDVYGVCWTHRNLDLSYVLFDWQYTAFCAASYFYRPLYWHAGYWHFGIYSRYPHRDYFYFGRPHFWTVYRGGHSWHSNGGRSWYNGRHYNQHRDNGRYFGMKDRHSRGDYKNGFDNRKHNGGNHHGNHGSNNNGGNSGFGDRNHGGSNNGGNSGFGDRNNNGTNSANRGFGSTRGSQTNASSGRTTVGSRDIKGTRSVRTNPSLSREKMTQSERQGQRTTITNKSRSEQTVGTPTRQSSTRTTVTRPSSSRKASK